MTAIGKQDVTIVLPTLNEEKAIGIVIDELRQEGYANILVVDGYSKDATVKIAEEKGVKIVYQHGKGKAGAIKTGIEHVETPYLLVMDADYTYDPKDIERFLEHAGRYDQIIGVRKNRENIPLFNRIGNWMITKTFNLLTGVNLSDVCSGMYLLKTEKARSLDLESTSFDVEVEIAVQIVANGDITEVPVSYRERIGERKLSSIKHGARIFLSMLNLARIYNPAFLFAMLTALALIPGTIVYLWVLYRFVFFGIFHSGWALLGTALIILGGQGLILSTVALLLKRMEKRIMGIIRSRS
ncbi:MAG: glycosyltransferase family 2 protein [Thermoproteota archaeon]|nr:glycosyltransferase [Candidatus Brockarchaeota archaeon]